MGSARRAVPNGRVRGFIVNLGIVRGPTDTGIKVGSNDPEDSLGYHLFNVFVDGAVNDAHRLVELNDSHIGVVLHGFTPATGGHYDAEIDRRSQDTTVTAATRRQDLRVKRDAIVTADLSAFDSFGAECRQVELQPDSLAAFDIETTGGGTVSLVDGLVEHRTGPGPSSRAALTRTLPSSPGRSFDDKVTLQTAVHTPENA